MIQVSTKGWLRAWRLVFVEYVMKFTSLRCERKKKHTSELFSG